MSGAPQFPTPGWVGAQPLRPGASAHKAGLSLEQRIAALENGAASRPGPGVVDGSVPVADAAAQGGLTWDAPIIGGYYASTSRNTAASSGWIALPNSIFDTAIAAERTLSGSSHFNTTTGVFTCPVTGWYDIHYRTSVAAVSDTGLLGNGLYINGALRYPRHFGPETEWYMSTSERVYLAATDTLAVRVHNPTAGAITMVGADLGRYEDCLLSWSLVCAA